MINKKQSISLTLSAALLLSFLLCGGCDQAVDDFHLDADGYANTTLSNGITLLMNHDEATALTSARILIGGGVLTETDANNGITNLMTKMLLKGNRDKTGAEIAEQLDFLGANVTVGCYRDYSTISFTSLTENFLDLLEIIALSILSPRFSPDELAKVKNEVAGDIVSSDDNQSMASSKLFWKTAYGQEGYGLPVLGTKSTIDAISVDDLQAHYDKYVGGENVILSISTDLDVHKLRDKIANKFKEMKAAAQPIPRPTLVLQSEKSGYIPYDRNQSFVYLGVVLDHLSAKEVPYVTLLNQVMGANVGSRLWYLRQSEKLAYNVFTQYGTDKYGALFRAGIGTDTLKVQIALASLNREWDQMVTDGITAEELTDARINMKNNLIFSIDRKSSRANNMAYYHWIGYNHRFVLDLIEAADQVTLSELNEFVSTKFTKDRQFTSIVGKD